MPPPDRYSDGRLKQSQDRADQQYRAKQRLQRAWITDVTNRLGIDKNQLIELQPESVADVIRQLLTQPS